MKKQQMDIEILLSSVDHLSSGKWCVAQPPPEYGQTLNPFILLPSEAAASSLIGLIRNLVLGETKPQWGNKARLIY